MTKTAPTTKIANGIDNGFYTELHSGVTVCAKSVDAEYAIDYDMQTGEEIYTATKAHYTITSHNGFMPAFGTERFDTLQELANAMRGYADLRTWRLIEHS